MSLFISPAQFSRHAEFYRQMGQLAAAGVPLTGALGHIQRTAAFRNRHRSPVAQIAQAIERGSTFSEAAALPSGWLPPFDLALIQAGEQSGRLDATFDLLAAYYEDRARVARQLLVGLAYPIFLLHMALFLLPFPELFIRGDWRGYLLKTVGVLIPIYFIVALGMFAAQSRHGEQWRAFMERVTGLIPLLGKARRQLAISRLASSLGAMLGAGVTVIEAWQLAAAACGSPRIRRTVASWIYLLEAGQTPAEVMQSHSDFPEIFTGQYATGEVSGKLDETLERMSVYYREEGTRRLHALAQWFPWLVYAIVAGFIIYKIFSFYSGYFQGIGNAVQGF